MGFICIVMLFGLFVIGPQAKADSSNFWVGYVFCGFYILIPLLIYLGVKKNFDKIRHTGEPKIYTLDDNDIKMKSPSINMVIDWSLIEKINERKSDFLAITNNDKGVHFWPKSGFADAKQINDFKILVKNKGIKIK